MEANFRMMLRSKDQAMYEDLKLYIDGEFTLGNSGAGEDVLNPATDAVLANVPHAKQAEMDAALASAKKGFEVWRKTSAYERSKMLRKAADLMRTRADDIARAMTLEQGKVLAEAKAETVSSADIIDWFAEEGRRAYGRIIPARADGVRQMVIMEPVGVVAGFSPWNFPVSQAVRKIAGALAAGCSIIVKCPEETPGSPVAMVRCFHDAGIPPGVVNLIFGVPAELSEYLIPHPTVRKISFTGSVPVGKHLASLAGQHMKRITMELGGHSPMLIFDDIDAEQVATLTASLKWRNAGQVCISPTRFFVHEKVYDKFVAKFTDIAKNTKVGDGLEPDTQMGPLANIRRINAMESIIADAQEKGAEVAAGGNRIGNQGQLLRADGADERAGNRTDHERGAVRPCRRDAPVQGYRRGSDARQQAALWPGELRLHAQRQPGDEGGGYARGRHGLDQPPRSCAARNAVWRGEGLGLRPRAGHRRSAGLPVSQVRQPTRLTPDCIVARTM